MSHPAKDAIRQAAKWLAAAKWPIALTGAGISVDSGIPDFRSPGGLWVRFDPFEYATIDAFHHHPRKVWQMLKELSSLIVGAEPNAGHKALADIEMQGKLKAVITQNVDNLHQAAGSRTVIEYHGNGATLVCLECEFTTTAELAEKKVEETGEWPPTCDNCGAILKPDVIFFGESIPLDAMMKSQYYAEKSDVILVCGTSATVAPASGIPIITKNNGGRIIELNITTTQLSPMADLTIVGSTSETLPLLAEELHSLLG